MLKSPEARFPNIDLHSSVPSLKHNNTLRRRGPKIISTNLTATWFAKCQFPRAQSTLMPLTSKVTINLTNKFIVDLVSFGVTQTITFAVSLVSRTPDFASHFGFAPAPLEAVPDTPPRPLIPPSQPRREGSAAGMGKNHSTTKQGRTQILPFQPQITLQQNGHCGGSNEDRKHQQNTTSKTTAQACAENSVRRRFRATNLKYSQK